MSGTLNQTAGLLLSQGKEHQECTEPSPEAPKRNQPARYNSQAVTPFSDTRTKPSSGGRSLAPRQPLYRLPPGPSLCDQGWPLSGGDRRPAGATQVHSLKPICVTGGIRGLHLNLREQPRADLSSKAHLPASLPWFFPALPVRACLPVSEHPSAPIGFLFPVVPEPRDGQHALCSSVSYLQPSSALNSASHAGLPAMPFSKKPRSILYEAQT